MGSVKYEILDPIIGHQHPKTPQGTENAGICEPKREIKSDSEETHVDRRIMMDSMQLRIFLSLRQTCAKSDCGVADCEYSKTVSDAHAGVGAKVRSSDECL